MEPWLQGVIAVTVFLVLAVIAFIINQLWCQDKKDSKPKKPQASFMSDNDNDNNESIFANGMEGSYSPTAAHFGCEEDPHVFGNKVEFECDTMTGYHTENHVNDGFQCSATTECHTDSCADTSTDM